MHTLSVFLLIISLKRTFIHFERIFNFFVGHFDFSAGKNINPNMLFILTTPINYDFLYKVFFLFERFLRVFFHEADFIFWVFIIKIDMFFRFGVGIHFFGLEFIIRSFKVLLVVHCLVHFFVIGFH